MILLENQEFVVDIWPFRKRNSRKIEDVDQAISDTVQNKPKDNSTDLSGLIFDRSIRPDDDDMFYHYCSVDTFKAIIETKTLRFSDINMMNDYGETEWSYKVFLSAANAILEEKKNDPYFEDFNEEFLDKIDEIIGQSQLYVHPVIACFSKSPDVLSQWRAYADNGRGFAVGFSGKVLKNLPVTILEITYDEATQIEEMKNAIGIIYVHYMNAGKVFNSKCVETAQLLSSYRYAYKNPGFSEENEVRCVHLLDIKRPGQFVHLEDGGGTAAGVEVPGEQVRFRVANAGIVAYIDIPFDRGNSQPLISRLFTGPANSNAPGNILYLLGSQGFHLKTLEHSETTFRS